MTSVWSMIGILFFLIKGCDMITIVSTSNERSRVQILFVLVKFFILDGFHLKRNDCLSFSDDEIHPILRALWYKDLNPTWNGSDQSLWHTIFILCLLAPPSSHLSFERTYWSFKNILIHYLILHPHHGHN
jgi:hypothetical protein